MPRAFRGRHRTTTLIFPSPASAMMSRWTRPLSYERAFEEADLGSIIIAGELKVSHLSRGMSVIVF
jgi:hypothetical protein